jgi:penicillin-binding protein 2
MEEVMEPGGTAAMSRIPGITMCGKTGTAQNPHGADHSVFMAFAPADHPKIAISVYVENGVWGARYAAPIASLMIEKYLTDSISSGRKWLEKRMLEANLLEPKKPKKEVRAKRETTVSRTTNKTPERDTVPPKEIAVKRDSLVTQEDTIN